MRVILVDDMLAVRALLRVYLMEFGFSFEEAPDGAQGLALARKQRPDLIISDVQMPVMDGLAFHAALRADPQLATVPLIFLTAEMGALPSDALTWSTAKPVLPDDLKVVVRRALSR